MIFESFLVNYSFKPPKARWNFFLTIPYLIGYLLCDRYIIITLSQFFLIQPSSIMILDGISQGLKVLRLWCVLDAARYYFCLTFIFVNEKDCVAFIFFILWMSSNFILFQGIQVQEYHGNFCKRIPTDVDLPGVC